jgi:enamine deaminase RidA (YjgF/YER057c/UK114 family)
VKRPLAPAGFAHFVRDWHFSPVLDTGEFVFLSGITGERADGAVAADPEEQIRDMFEILKTHLTAAGLGFDDVVDMTTYHVGLRDHLDIFMKIKDQYVHEPYPAWTAIGVSQLIGEAAIVEIRIIARKP